MASSAPILILNILCLYHFQDNPKQKQKEDSLWKVAPILDQLQKNCHCQPSCLVTGKFVSIDEQTIGFKGKHILALCISYKREGNGYQCDALCEV